jgi:hypothetical protein
MEDIQQAVDFVLRQRRIRPRLEGSRPTPLSNLLADRDGGRQGEVLDMRRGGIRSRPTGSRSTGRRWRTRRMTASSAGIRKFRFMPERLSGRVEPSTATANPTSTF